MSLKKGNDGGVTHIMEPNAGMTMNCKRDNTKLNEVTKTSDTEVKAPLVGTFYRAPSPEEPPFVEVGQQVKKGDVIGIIEAMKLMNEVTATEDGVVTAINIENGVMVEYGTTLVTIGKK